jgi:hypothetical protein
MSPLMILLIAWGALTALLIILLIYRSTLTMHEDDQLFLDEAEAHMRLEQEENNKKINRVTPFVKLLGATSGLLVLVMAGMWVYQEWNRVQ